MTPTEAATIAKAHGLGPADAAALRTLTDDPTEATRIAAIFAGTEAGDKTPERALLDALRGTAGGSAETPTDSTDETPERAFLRTLLPTHTQD